MTRTRSFLGLALFAASLGCSDKSTNFDSSNDQGGGPTGGTSGATTTGGNATGGVSPTGGSGGMTAGAGAGGLAGTGGSAAGTGGAGGAGTGGVSATGGVGAAGGGGGGPEVPCTINVTSSLSTRIPTVGIVEFSSDLAGITQAQIDFGRDTTYGFTAPVDLAATNYRTLLLGMKPSNMYHFRVSVSGATGRCTGQDQTITTGARANGLPTLDVMTNGAAALSGGFLITGGRLSQGGGDSAPAYIIDADGEIVWWFMMDSDVSNARMSYDGRFMWMNSVNVPSTDGANVHRVSMDGMTDENLTSQFTGANHQLTVLPDESVIFYAYGTNGCDDLKERLPNGTVRTIINARDAHGATGNCHLNHVEYSPEDDTLVFSDLNHNNYTKVRRNGEVVWVLGGPTSEFTGPGATWTRQHGADVLSLDRLLIFNNGATGGGGAGSLAIELLLDLGASTATRAWTYAAMPTIANQIMGDVQRMDNGNTIVAYSTQGVVHEVSSTGALLQEINWPLGGAFGYIQKRKTLYGPPPR